MPLFLKKIGEKMKYLVWLLLVITISEGIIIKKLVSKKPVLVVVEQENDFYKSLPTVPKETIKGVE